MALFDPKKSQISQLQKSGRLVLIDCPAGVERGFRNVLNAGVDQAILVTTPDDISMRDAERAAQIMEAKHSARPRLIVNRLDNDLIRKGEMYSARTVADTLDLELLGEIPEDQAVYLDRLARAASTATYQTYGLTEAERALFQERRKLANQEYTTESTKLFDGEIEYKRKQYEAYFQRVRNVGQDVADTHFRTLIAEGSSFTAWINKQIADLEAKRSANPGSFTQGDANALNALRMQQNEITGAKSAMDLFKESVSRAVNQAQTLAEKLQAIADLKERLANGEFHLNQDETAAASYQLNQQDSDLSKQVTDEVLEVCPLTIWKLDCVDVLGPIKTSSSPGIIPARKPFTSCVLTVYDRRNCSPTATCEGARPTIC